MSFDLQSIIPNLAQTLRQFSHADLMDSWRIVVMNVDVESGLTGLTGDEPIAAPPSPATFAQAPLAQLDDRRYALWRKGQAVAWFGQTLTIPETLNGYPTTGKTLRLALRWWAEAAQVFVNGQPVLAGDLYDCFGRIVLAESAEPGTQIAIAIRLVSPGHDAGALVRSVLQYEAAYTPDQLDPAFVADELEVVFAQIPAIDHNSQTQQFTDFCELLQPIYSLVYGVTYSEFLKASQAKNFIDSVHLVDSKSLDQLLRSLHEALPKFLHNTLDQFQKTPLQLSVLGHAHLDMAWLWDLAETYRAAQRTFTSVLNLQAQFPELIFTHSSPALYAWLEVNQPELFTQIQTQVKDQRWDVAAGLWVEPELNIIAGESIARQILYAQTYCLEKFGEYSRVAWLPDSFGFCWQLPQFLNQGSIDYFVTQKLRWNDTTQFPYDLFRWQAPDGTETIAYMSGLIGQDIEPIAMVKYAQVWQEKTGCDRALWLPGVGDHGGGPTRDMLEVLRRWQDSPVFPAVDFCASDDFLDQTITAVQRNMQKSVQNTSNNHVKDTLKQELQDIQLKQNIALPVWKNELYLEYHRGCFTTHAGQKQANRICEILLYQAELLSSIASQILGVNYPREMLETAWKAVLLNQFHDILPGSAIPEVYRDANQGWIQAETLAKTLRDRALKTLFAHLHLPTPPQPDAIPIVIFNPVLGQRSNVITLTPLLLSQLVQDIKENQLPRPLTQYQITDAMGQVLPVQASDQDLKFVAELKQIGVTVFWLIPLETTANFIPNCYENLPQTWVLENEFLYIEIHSETGDIKRCFDKQNQQEVLAITGGNRLEAYGDSGQYWDAWNIDPNYEQYQLSPIALESIAWVETGLMFGGVRSRLRVVRRLGQSRFTQDYILEAGSPLLEIATTVDWQERHVLVKVAFDLAIAADRATYEMPCGAIERPINPQTPAERAQWEVPLLQWFDLGRDAIASGVTSYGVSLLNDCKYGADAKPHQMRLTLLRGATWPDPEADLGTHQFRYALYPHAGDWRVAQTVQRAIAFNQAPIVHLLPSGQSASPAGQNSLPNRLPSDQPWLTLGDSALVLMAWKRSEDTQTWIMRCYESTGNPAMLQLGGWLGEQLRAIVPVDLLERPLTMSPTPANPPSSSVIAPWRVFSLQMQTRTGSAG